MTPQVQGSTDWVTPRMFGREPRNFRPIPTEGGKRLLVPLTKGYFAKIDAEDLPLIGDRPWSASVHPSGAVYAIQSVIIDGKKSIRTLHRVIMGIDKDRSIYGKKSNGKTVEVDHERRTEFLNNTRENLRLANRTQQNYNQRTKRNSKTGFKGVKFRPAAYQAYLNHDSKRVSFGYFDNPLDAARARDRGAIQLHGEFASLNFPRSDYGEVPPYRKVDGRKKRRGVDYWGEAPSKRPAS